MASTFDWTDPLLLDDALTDDERAARDAVRDYAQGKLMPRVKMAFREVDLVIVKGRTEPVGIYEPMGPKDALDPALRNDLARHRGAMKLYRAQKWDEAEAEFFDLSQGERAHPLYGVFMARILHWRENPPPKNWAGAWKFETK